VEHSADNLQKNIAWQLWGDLRAQAAQPQTACLAINSLCNISAQK